MVVSKLVEVIEEQKVKTGKDISKVIDKTVEVVENGYIPVVLMPPGVGKTFVTGGVLSKLEEWSLVYVICPGKKAQDRICKILEDLGFNVLRIVGMNEFTCPLTNTRMIDDVVPCMKVRRGREKKHEGHTCPEKRDPKVLPSITEVETGGEVYDVETFTGRKTFVFYNMPCPYWNQFRELWSCYVNKEKTVVVINDKAFTANLHKLPIPDLAIFDEYDIELFDHIERIVPVEEVKWLARTVKKITDPYSDILYHRLMYLYVLMENGRLKILDLREGVETLLDAYEFLCKHVQEEVINEICDFVRIVKSSKAREAYQCRYLRDSKVISIVIPRLKLIDFVLKKVGIGMLLTATPPSDEEVRLFMSNVREKLTIIDEGKKLLGKAVLHIVPSCLLGRLTYFDYFKYVEQLDKYDPEKALEYKAKWILSIYKLVEYAPKPIYIPLLHVKPFLPWLREVAQRFTSVAKLLEYVATARTGRELVKKFIETRGKEPPVLITTLVHRAETFEFVNSIIVTKCPRPFIGRGYLTYFYNIRGEASFRIVMQSLTKRTMLQWLGRVARVKNKIYHIYTPDKDVIDLLQELRDEGWIDLEIVYEEKTGSESGGEE